MRMSIVSALGDATGLNFANISAIGIAGAQDLGVFVPNGVLQLLIADSGDSVERALVEIAGDIAFQNKTATAIYCAGVGLANIDAIFGMLNNVACNLCGVMAQILNNVMSAVQMQINIAVDTVIGSVGKLIDSVLELINGILRLTDTLLGVPQALRDAAIRKMNDRTAADKCMDMIADILACMLNRYVGDPLMKFQNRIIDKIHETGFTMNQALADEFADVNILSNYILQESFMLNKCNLLAEGLYATFDGTNTAAETNAITNATAQANGISIDENGKATASGTNTGESRMTETNFSTTSEGAQKVAESLAKIKTPEE